MTALHDYQFKEYMARVNLSLFTPKLKLHGYFTLRDIASSKQCSSESFLESLGMNRQQTDDFFMLRDTLCEVFNIQRNQIPSHRARQHSTATSDIINVSLPLNVTFDKELKVLKVANDSQVSPQEIGRRVISVGGIIVVSTKDFKTALESCKSKVSTTCELVYVDPMKPPPLSVSSPLPAPVVVRKPPPPPTPPTRRATQTAAEDEDEEMRKAIEASMKEDITPVKKPIVEDDEEEQMRKAIEESMKLLEVKSPAAEKESEEQILAAVMMASSSECEREAAMKKREAEANAREEELVLRAALAESEVTEVRGRLASTDMSMEWARRESLQASGNGGAVFVSGAEIYKIPREKLKLEPEPFAKGGGGQIFKGKYMGNEIAAKQVFSNMMKEDDRAEFDIEVATLTKLSHPCIMACYGMCQENNNGDLFMVLEYCGGGDLDGFYQSPHFTKLEFKRVMSELLSGISYIHARSIAHRDLKPANVLLDGMRKVKIADFGLARQDHLTVERGIGTPAYMPPEMLREDGDDTTNVLAIDVYAMGVIMWQLWYRKIPFEGKAIHKIMSMVTRGKRPPITTFNDKLKDSDDPMDIPPTELANLISSCWSQDEQLRPNIDSVFSAFDEVIGPLIEKNFADDLAQSAPVADLRTTSSESAPATQLTF